MRRISVVISAYNAEFTILETVESVLKQTFSDFEIIVINDGSTDRTLEVLKSITDQRLKIFSYDNGGASTSRNRGIAHAQGEFIAFLDADDLWTPDKLELQLKALEQHPKAGVAYSWTYYFIDGQEESLSPGKQFFFEGNVYPQLLLENFLSNGSNPLIRKEVIKLVGEFDTSLKNAEDWDFYLRLAACCDFAVVPNYQIFYRRSSRSKSSKKIDVVEEQLLKVLEKAYWAVPPEYKSLKNQSLAWVYEYSTQQYLQNSSDISGVNQATQKLWKAIRLHPQILSRDYAQHLIRWLIKKWVQETISRVFR